MARKQGSHAEITGPKLREAALRLFAQSGYAAVTMRQIAGEVGVQVGALYNYIPDKQTLLYELMKSHLEEVLDALDVELRTGGAEERLRRFVHHHIHVHLPRRDAIRLAYDELRSLEPQNFAAIEKLRHAYENHLQGILEQGVAEGLFRVADLRVTTMALIGLLTGLFGWYRENGRLTPVEVEALYYDLVRKAIAAP